MGSSAPLLQLSLKKDSRSNRFVRWLYKNYRNEEPPPTLNLCNAFWGVVVRGTVVLAARFLFRPFCALDRFFTRHFPAQPYDEEKALARMKRKRQRRRHRKQCLMVAGNFLWMLLWPVRFVAVLFLRMLASAVVPVVSWCRKHKDVVLLTLLVAAGLITLAGLVVVSVSFALDYGWWAGFMPVVFVAGVFAIGSLLVFVVEPEHFRFLKPVCRFLARFVKLPWLMAKVVWVILVAVKYRLCPLVRVE